MDFSHNCYDLIKRWEGCFLDAYADPYYKWDLPTIGIGTTHYRVCAGRFGRTKVKQGDKISLTEAYAELAAELDEIEPLLNKLISVPVTQAEFDALGSFCYNCGVGAFEGSTMRKKLNSRDYKGAQEELDKWVNSNGQFSQGLQNRRDSEQDLFDNDGLIPVGTVPAKPDSTGRKYEPCALPLDLGLGLLLAGSKSIMVYRLQCALIELGYLASPKDGEMIGDVFNEHVDFAVKKFQEDNMGVGSGDGMVGGNTTKALGTALATKRQPVATKPLEKVCKVTKTGMAYTNAGSWNGLQQIKVQLGNKVFNCVSGQKNNQVFLKGGWGTAGTGQPCEQGSYTVSDINWEAGKDNYQGNWGDGLGAWVIDMYPTFKTARSAILFHVDSNESTRPGTMGCIGVHPRDEKEFIKAWREVNPQIVDVDWRL